MKIVNRATFLAMPAGTLFSKFEPMIFEDLCIKGDTVGGNVDFMYQQIADAIDADDSFAMLDLCETSTKNGSSFSLDLDCQGRDGCFDDEQLFALWERADVEQLIARLQVALNDGYRER